jgi:wyosine [tRNA(Phe)-imidazoG37] synthetase (radical SAM superfamily)
MPQTYKYLFGPVPSRRLGRSLGVDLTPFKTCSFDCVFCQLGRTTRKTVLRKEYVPLKKVQAELARWVKGGGKTDYITLAGSGEPTLHLRFGEVLGFIRKHTPFPAVLLSNGTLFDQPAVRKSACQADIVKLSLSAWDQDSFEHINRPHPSLVFNRVVDGYRAFRDEFRGKLWIEVFLLWGMNSVPRDVEKIAKLVKTIGPDEIHLNTAVRPPAEDFAVPVPRRQMESLASLFRPRAKIIAEFPADKSADIAANETTILAMLRRRPCTARQIADVFGMHLNEVAKYLGKLTRTGAVRAQVKNRETYYAAVKHTNG